MDYALVLLIGPGVVLLVAVAIGIYVVRRRNRDGNVTPGGRDQVED